METVHHDVVCDGCFGDRIIRGTRYKCANCLNYDLCARCYMREADMHANGGHVFITARRELCYTTTVPLLPLMYAPTEPAIVERPSDDALDRAYLQRVQEWRHSELPSD